MNKKEFLDELRVGLAGLPESDLEERLNFYEEMIDDRIDEGLTEEEAIAGLGTVEQIIDQIAEETPLSKLVKKKIKNRRRLRTWEIVLLSVGSIVWFPILLAFAAVALSLYAVLWTLVIVCTYAVQAIFGGCALGAITGGIIQIVHSDVWGGILLIGGGLVLAGLTIFMIFACKWATLGTIRLTKKIILGIKSKFIRKESVK
jgi:uncharacterized membrane protein